MAERLNRLVGEMAENQTRAVENAEACFVPCARNPVLNYSIIKYSFALIKYWQNNRICQNFLSGIAL